MQSLLERLVNKQALQEDEIAHLFDHMLDGQMHPSQIAAFLTAWRINGESKHELAIGATKLRERAEKMFIPDNLRPLLDNCGTGGDGQHSFNISTASAIVAAAAGVKIAKHGNRSVSSQCGSADLLFAAGFPTNLSGQSCVKLLEKTGLTFFFAPHFHPALQHIMPIRKELGIRTIFNLLGPLANPIAPENQLLGVGKRGYLEPMADALIQLKIKNAAIVHSHDGMDEISPCDRTDMIRVTDRQKTALTINPKDFAINSTHVDIKGGDPKTNLDILINLLQGNTNGPFGAIVLNTAAILWLANKSKDFSSGTLLAQDILRSGKAQNYFFSWIKTAQEIAHSE